MTFGRANPDSNPKLTLTQRTDPKAKATTLILQSEINPGLELFLEGVKCPGDVI